jgi:chromosome segregation ATPase
VAISSPGTQSSARLGGFAAASGEDLAQRRTELDVREKQLDERQLALERQAQEFTEDRVIWYQRREEIEKEIQQARQARQSEIARASPQETPAKRARPVSVAPRGMSGDEFAEREQQLLAREEQVAREQQELAALRQEFAEIRQQLYERYRQRRDRLTALQAAVNQAARKVQESKRQLETETKELAAQRVEEAARRDELDAQKEQLAGKQGDLSAQTRALAQREAALQADIARQQADFDAQRNTLAVEKESLHKGKALHQEDLVRLDRLQAAIEQRRQQIDERDKEVNQRFQQLHDSTQDLQEQVREVQNWKEETRRESEDLAKRRTELDSATADLTERSAAIEGQQVMLASLRTRLERTREELRREQQQSAEQRARLDSLEAELKLRIDELNSLRGNLDTEKQLREGERREFEKRRSELETALAQVQQAQAALAEQKRDLDCRSAELTETLETQTRAAERLRLESSELVELQKRVALDRDSIRERENALVRSEQVREALQEQLRRRSEELSSGHRELADERRKLDGQSTVLQARQAELESERVRMEERLASAGQDLDARAAELQRAFAQLKEHDNQRLLREERLRETGRRLGRARKSFWGDRVRWQAQMEKESEAIAQGQAEVEAARHEVAALVQQLPDLELRAQGAAERLARSREELREHLAELHSYAQQSHEDIESLRSQVLLEAEQVQQQRVAIHRAREEHRLAVAAFRQQLIEWQGQVAQVKVSLAHGEIRLERRQARVDEASRRIDATSHRLAEQAGQLQEQERFVAESRKEVEKHLDDMREWYRRKLRELSERRQKTLERRAHLSASELSVVSASSKSTHAANDGGAEILSFSQEVDPGDRKLGELLHSLKLVDIDTLQALLGEAAGNHRSLRQALLAGGYLTVYQMALIETGHLDALVLGPVRVVDRIRATPRETAYRVFDPRRGSEALLRHLAEAEMEDAVHPDEFRQRFGQAATIKHPNLADTFEVLDIAGRPAVLQGWLSGLPGSDWPPVVAAPGVWYRLVYQSALGLHAAHRAGLVHGHLNVTSFLLTLDGIVKLSGLGEPEWLALPALRQQKDVDFRTDVLDFASIALSWANPAPRKKSVRPRITDEILQPIHHRLAAVSPEERYPDVAALIEDLERFKSKAPSNDDAWQRLLKLASEHASKVTERRQSA